MIVHILPEVQAGFLDASHYVELGFGDLTAAGNTQTINVFAPAAKMGLNVQFVSLVEAFVSSDGTLISTAITVGDTGSANRFVTSMELNAAGTTVWLKGGVALNPILQVYTAADQMQVAFTATAAKLLNTHTAGKVRIWFVVRDARGAGFPLVQ